MLDDDGTIKLITIGIFSIISLILIGMIVNSLISWWNSSIDIPGLGEITNGSLIIFIVLILLLTAIYTYLDKNRF